jgi:hypothetical protein
MMDIRQNLKLFVDGAGKNRGMQPSQRSASFDYCFNYFQSFREEDRIEELAAPSHMEVTCLQLAFYLASWGMLRGSSFLLEKSLRFYRPLIEGIATFDKRIWTIDADSYDDDNIATLLACKDMIVESLGKENKPSDTLVTKIMLGVFGNVPAFDDFFRKGLVVHSLREKSLVFIREFYEENKTAIDGAEYYTFDYATALLTHRKYTKAKIIDMVGNIEGLIKKQSSQK